MKKLFTCSVVVLCAALLAQGQNAYYPVKPEPFHGFNKYTSTVRSIARQTQYSPILAKLWNQHLSQNQQKQSLVVKQRLDSLIQMVQEPFKQSMSLINDQKVLFFYDANQVQTHETAYSWDDFQNEWMLDTKTEFTYNAFGQPLTYTDYYWEPSQNQWVLDYKIEFEYDNNGNMVTETDSYYDVDSLLWRPEYRYDYTYDMSGIMTTIILLNFDNSIPGWVPNWKMEFEYTGTMAIEKETVSHWDSFNNQWYYEHKSEYTYDVNNDLTQMMEFGWDIDNNIWTELFKTIYTYNINGILVQELKYAFSSAQWIYYTKTVYTHDLMNNITLTSNFYYSIIDSAWNENYRDHIDYNLSYPYSELILPTTWWWFGTPAAFMVSAMYGEEYNNGSWMDSYHDTFYYTAVNIIGIPENNTGKVRIYPNPASNEIRISWDCTDLSIEFELSDVAGRLVMKHHLNNGGTLDVSQLGQGVYNYKIFRENNNVPVTGKIIIH